MVLDASAILAWCFKEEQTAPIRAVLRAVWSDGATVPPLWRLEVANALCMGVRRGRLTEPQREQLFRDLDALPIEVDPAAGTHVWPGTVRLADRHRLTVYDACYLELALGLGQPIATLDSALRRAAATEGLDLLGQ